MLAPVRYRAALLLGESVSKSLNFDFAGRGHYKTTSSDGLRGLITTLVKSATSPDRVADALEDALALTETLYLRISELE